MGKKSSREKIMEKMTSSMVAPGVGNPNCGYFNVRWDRREVDGKTKVFFSVEDDSERDYSKPPPVKKEYTDKDEFMSVVAGKIGDFIKEA